MQRLRRRCGQLQLCDRPPHRAFMRLFAAQALVPERWLVRKTYTRVRRLADLLDGDAVYQLAQQTRAYVKWFQRSGTEPFFHRKSHRVVLAVLHLDYNGASQYVRGVNSEVSLPTGSICAERAAITHARTAFPGVRREHMKGISVIEVPLDLGVGFVADKSLNPLPPCGACREWLEKIQEESPGFYVLSFPDLSFCEVHERFLFWSVQEETFKPEDLGPWVCDTCLTRNEPFSSQCGHCHSGRFSVECRSAELQPDGGRTALQEASEGPGN